MNELFKEEGQSSPIAKEEVVLTESPAEVLTAETKTEVAEGTKPETKEAEQTTEAKTEAKEEEKKTSLFDKFTQKDAEAKTEAAKEEPKSVEITAEFKQELDQAKAELKKYKDSPIAKLLGGDYDLTKVDVKELLTKALGENFNGLSDDQLIEKSLIANPNFAKLSSDDQKEEIDNTKARFEVMSKLEKLTERDNMVKGLNSNSTPSDLFSALEEIQAGQKNLVDPEKFFEEKSKEKFQKTYGTIRPVVEELSKSLVGQKYGEYIVTEQDSADTVSLFEDEILSFDTEKKTFNAFKAATYDRAVEAAEKRGYEKAVLEAANPNVNSSSAPRLATKDKDSMATATTHDFYEQANN